MMTQWESEIGKDLEYFAVGFIVFMGCLFVATVYWTITVGNAVELLILSLIWIAWIAWFRKAIKIFKK